MTRREADETVSSVSESTEHLFTHVSAVQSLETDIRFMGLNMSFRCDRLGDNGRALSVIAQELRLSATKIAEEAREIIADLEQVKLIAGALDGVFYVAAECYQH